MGPLTLLFLPLLGISAAAEPGDPCHDPATNPEPYVGDAAGLARLLAEAPTPGVLRMDAEVQAVGADGLAPLHGLVRACGDLTLRGFSATDLRGLDGLKAVDGALRVEQVAGLGALDGLGALAAAGALSVEANPALSSLAGLSRLERVSGDIEIYKNDRLVSADLPALREVGGSLVIWGLPADEDEADYTLPARLERVEGDLVLFGAEPLAPGPARITGAGALREVGGRFMLGGVNSLRAVTAFGSLSRVGRGLSIVSARRLEDLSGLAQLQTVGGDLLLHCLPELRSLDGFRGLQLVRGGLVLVGTPDLLDGRALSSSLTLGSLYLPPRVQIELAPGAPELADRVGVLSWFMGPILGSYAQSGARRGSERPEDLEQEPRFVAFATSGGGLRQGTFALGVQRGLAALRLDGAQLGEELSAVGSALGMVDLFSSVSGGGFSVGWLLGHEGKLPAREIPEGWRHGRLATLRPLRTSLRSLQTERRPRDGYQRLLGRWYTAKGSGGLLAFGDIWKPISSPEAWEPLWIPNATDLVRGQPLPMTPAAFIALGVDAWWEGGRRQAPDCDELGCDYDRVPMSLGMTASASVPPVFPGILLGASGAKPIQAVDGAFVDRFAANGAMQALWEIEESGYADFRDLPGTRSVLLLSYTRPDVACWAAEDEHLPPGTRSLERSIDQIRAHDDEERLDYLLGPRTDGVRPLFATRSVLPLIQTVNLGLEILVHRDVWASLPEAGACKEAMSALYQRVACLPTDLTLPEEAVQDVYDAGTMVANLQQAVLRQTMGIASDGALLDRGGETRALLPMLIPERFVASCGGLNDWRFAGDTVSTWELDLTR